MATIDWDDRQDELAMTIGDVERVALLLERTATLVRSQPLCELDLTIALSELRALTTEDPWWDDTIMSAIHHCAGVRLHGALVLGPEFTWSCAARAVEEIVEHMGAAVWQHAPFGRGLERLNTAYDRTVRREAIRAGRATEEQIGDDVPAARRIRLYPVLPPRDAVLRAGWPGGARSVPEVEVGDDVWAAVDDLRGVWDRGRRAINTVLARQREHLATVPLRRIREELAWEYARVAYECELRSAMSGAEPDAPGHLVACRANGRLDERDQWIYQQVMEGALTYNGIRRRLSRLALERGWAVVGTVESIRQRAIRYAEANGLTPPPARQSR
jgi:hypothetical protein